MTSAKTVTATFRLSKFFLNDRVRANVDQGVRNTPNGTLLGSQRLGALGTILDGPASANGYLWWNVNFDTGVDGWTIASGLTKLLNQPPTVTFTASPASIISGATSTLTWLSSTNTTSCTGTGFVASGVSGTLAVTPLVTTTYTLTCSGAGGASLPTSVTVTITAPTTQPSITAPTSISYRATTDKLTYTQDEKIQISVSAINNSGETKTLNFTSGCQAYYSVASYDSRNGQACTTALTSVTIPAYGVKTWTLVHDPLLFRIPVGQYKLLGGVIGYGEAPTLITVGNTTQPSTANFKFEDSRKNTFVFKLNDPSRIQEARDILAGKIGSRMVVGIIVKNQVPYNTQWSFHLDPNSVHFAENAIEVCDAGIQYVQDHLSEVGGAFLPDNRWCPWSSRLVAEISIPSTQPTALFTIEGQDSYTYNVGQINHFKWDSSNANIFSSYSVANNPTKCGQGVWVANTARGESRTYLGPDWAGCIWDVTYTAKNSTTGQSVSKTVKVSVNPLTTTMTTSTVQSADLNQMANVIESIRALLDQIQKILSAR